MGKKLSISIGQNNTDVSLGFGGDAYGGYLGSDFVIKHNKENTQNDWAMNDNERMIETGEISSPSANNVFASIDEEGYVDLTGNTQGNEGNYHGGGDNFHGVPIHDSQIGDLKTGGAFTVPYAGIFVSKSYYADKPKAYMDLLRHEFGHSIQYQKYGVGYFGVVAPVSIWSAYTDPGGHQYNSWTENEANSLSFEFFGRPSDWNHVAYPTMQDILKK